MTFITSGFLLLLSYVTGFCVTDNQSVCPGETQKRFRLERIVFNNQSRHTIFFAKSGKENPGMLIDDPIVSRFVFHPRKESLNQRLVGISTETVSGGEKIGGYLYLHPESRVLTIFFHGNGEIAADYDDFSRFYVACGASFWVVDYRGYGKSTGTPTYSQMFVDADTIFQEIGKIEKISGRTFHHIMVMGRSLGSASAIYLASSHPDRVSALILDSPFSDGPALISRLGGPKLPAEPLSGKDNIDRIKTILPSTFGTPKDPPPAAISPKLLEGPCPCPGILFDRG